MTQEPEEKHMPLLDHLIELRQRLIYSAVSFLACFLVAFFFAGPIFNFLVQPLTDLWQGQESRRLIYTALHEKFFTEIKVAFFAGAFLAFPLISNQIWMFVAPGLYRHEKKAFLPFLIATPFLFVAGGAFVYYFVLPVAWKFFVSFEQAAGEHTLAIALEPKVDQYLSLVMRLIFAFGISFELPVLLTLLARVGLATSEGMRQKRRYAIVGAFIAAAILTPPDPLSQIGLALPIILLYEISIWCARLVEKQRENQEKADDEAQSEDDLGEQDGESEDEDDTAPSRPV